ncbi:uncharacterized protein PgNI_12087 [Pyricularia grisea]|uniref:DUF6604 domain-containing protein n=1 Tax=Pyricularia grisea TaxID=148305 RepID=A0A6P8AR02_PYRGI|nr:uncharacterized protein PgNI_12087 [Pyricularia grisea]TLD04471.1 hypothetical protein PgNI_12087 [Pyricularia grisea]
MFSNFLQNSYRQYKNDTNRFAIWLVNFAKKVGLEPACLSSIPAAKRKKKDAGSASKAAKYQITVGEFLTLARAIFNTSLKAPSRMLNVAKRAITFRKNVILWFLGRGRDAVEKRHAHFIQVLEEICELLSWETTPSFGLTSIAHRDKKPIGVVENYDSSAPAWVNWFASFVVENAENELATLTINNVIQLEIVENDAKEPDNDFLSQPFFRILCLLHNLSNWKRFLSDTLARNLVQDVLEDHQHQFPVGGIGLQQLGGLPYNEELLNIAEFAFFPTGVLLQLFFDVIKNGNIPIYKLDYYGNYNAKTDRFKMSVIEKFNKDKIFLLELFPEYCVVANFGALLPVRDEITANFVEYYTIKNFNLWYYFAFQIVLDVYHVIRYYRLNAAANLRINGLYIAKIIDEYFKLSKIYPYPEFWFKKGNLEIKKIRNLIATWIERDPFLVIRMDAYSVIDKNNRFGA